MTLVEFIGIDIQSRRKYHLVCCTLLKIIGRNKQARRGLRSYVAEDVADNNHFLPATTAPKGSDREPNSRRVSLRETVSSFFEHTCPPRCSDREHLND